MAYGVFLFPGSVNEEQRRKRHKPIFRFPATTQNRHALTASWGRGLSFLPCIARCSEARLGARSHCDAPAVPSASSIFPANGTRPLRCRSVRCDGPSNGLPTSAAAPRPRILVKNGVKAQHGPGEATSSRYLFEAARSDVAWPTRMALSRARETFPDHVRRTGRDGTGRVGLGWVGTDVSGAGGPQRLRGSTHPAASPYASPACAKATPTQGGGGGGLHGCLGRTVFWAAKADFHRQMHLQGRALSRRKTSEAHSPDRGDDRLWNSSPRRRISYRIVSYRIGSDRMIGGLEETFQPWRAALSSQLAGIVGDELPPLPPSPGPSSKASRQVGAWQAKESAARRTSHRLITDGTLRRDDSAHAVTLHALQLCSSAARGRSRRRVESAARQKRETAAGRVRDSTPRSGPEGRDDARASTVAAREVESHGSYSAGSAAARPRSPTLSQRPRTAVAIAVAVGAPSHAQTPAASVSGPPPLTVSPSPPDASDDLGRVPLLPTSSQPCPVCANKTSHRIPSLRPMPNTDRRQHRPALFP
ncbi:hypothetical protein PMIN01_07328 [Paraphaeosphaeria minitans]|uniref:Uncharacterized protein n=1 Tax=Paraphaeosphaeria minitans TaxID=565426 RepID=A0A9P6KPV1_9PLEO|nr:hypothetical protein PMIN01_07328 [Paraphaeosphaeria minitans]